MRDEPSPHARRPVKRRITLSLAVLVAVLALLVGVVLGWAARGGPADGVLVTTEQEVPVVTVTVPAEPGS